ncbi:hypothetical protein [Bogoriella caseilytica]|uniref:hypothetical protein n=1 Tax=Bogoriella caseilytica TaxID=56055 RepID=UPI0011CED1C8|nr:hypothetical protein [Bogoriella caseilytica]
MNEFGTATFTTSAVSEFSGTGEPGAEIAGELRYVDLELAEGGADPEEVEPLVLDPVTVSEAGTWQLELEAQIDRGAMLVVLEQSLEGEVVDGLLAQIVVFTPTSITSVAEGETFDVDEAPAEASGGIDPVLGRLTLAPEAPFTVEASLSGDAEGLLDVVIDDGSWSVDFDGQLEVGDYTLTIDHEFDLGAIFDDELPPVPPSDVAVLQQQDPAEVEFVNAIAPVSVSFSVVEPEEPVEPADVTLDHFTDYTLYTGPITTLSGTGEPGAEVTVEANVYELIMGDDLGAFEYGPTEVAADGTWILELDPVIARGSVDLFVEQIAGDDVRSEASVGFVEVFEATTITSITMGEEFELDAAPTGAAGTVDPELDGYGTFFGEVESINITTGAVLSDGTTETATEVAIVDGEWTTDFGDALEVGDYTLTIEHELEPRNEQPGPTPGPTPLSGAASTSPATDRGQDEFAAAAQPLAAQPLAEVQPLAVEQPPANELASAVVTFSVVAAEEEPPPPAEEPSPTDEPTPTPTEDDVDAGGPPGTGALPETGLDSSLLLYVLGGILLIGTGTGALLSVRSTATQ